MYRLQLLGFNAVRLPFSFSDLYDKQPLSQQRNCAQARSLHLCPDMQTPGTQPQGPNCLKQGRRTPQKRAPPSQLAAELFASSAATPAASIISESEPHHSTELSIDLHHLAPGSAAAPQKLPILDMANCQVCCRLAQGQGQESDDIILSHIRLIRRLAVTGQASCTCMH